MPSVNLRFKVTVRSKVNLVHFVRKIILNFIICIFMSRKCYKINKNSCQFIWNDPEASHKD